MRRGGIRGRTRGAGFHWGLLGAARDLAARFEPPLPLEAIVVFYPKCRANKIRDGLLYVRRKGKIEEFRGLTISATRRLRFACMAFRISDVEAHRTPADAYHIDIRASGKRRKVEPSPLYSASENFGKELHE